ncbi:hypothetical protein HUA76_30955 [Myxococcus sp. CA056]|uniref:hypothetical protein n=1 Tax=unclassified Myxococcus TaxID=2648731 RepID=UPI00157B37D3|nr:MULTISPECIES: hypothetical protein [unclassified Myxococcus]NTX15213.1 hypothetical protein [Myxococcus sp. CA056]NTX41702.1 hypothetical protein [Myxococcus sp. CA033]NTX52999.1 hypothetical protein [Myxococcus sp. CA039A]
MSKLHQTLLTASVALLGLNGCGGADLPEAETASTRQGVEVATAIPLPIPACSLLPDTDGDAVCDIVETLLGTNPNNPDTDGDRLNDYAESFGFGGGLDLTALGANARRKDIFIEADYYPGQQPTQAMLNRVITAFANAPVSNPDGSTGITLHVVVDQQITAADADLDLSPVWTDFDVIKGKYFAANRAPYFHYMLFANRYDGGNSSGISRGIPAHDFVVTLGFIGGGTELQRAGTLMHELGHNIGLRHGGTDNANYKPNYLSVMNYQYQFDGFGIGGLNNVFDYSRVQVAAFSELSINEVAAFTPVAPTTEADLAKISALRFNGVQVVGNASANLDFNNNGTIQAASYSRDLDGSGASNFPASQNDWLALAYDGGGQIGFATSGLTQDLGRAELFLVAPEKMEPCLTVPERDAR